MSLQDDLSRLYSRTKQQLVARIKRSSKYYGQTPPGEWFDVRVVGERSYPLRGNNNNYQFRDVVLGVKLDDGTIITLRQST
jgi:hypothetical protein